MDENRLNILARHHGVRQNRDDGGGAKLLPHCSVAPMREHFRGSELIYRGHLHIIAPINGRVCFCCEEQL